MVRGQKSELGDVRKAQNGYWYIRTEDGWRLMHHVIAEKSLGRPLKSYERVYFVNGNKDEYHFENLEIKESLRNRSRIASYILKIDKMMEELAAMKEALVEEFSRENSA